MTITAADREAFAGTAERFHSQPELDNCLPTAVKNLLDELAERTQTPSLKTSLSTINEHLDYQRGAAAAGDRLGARLDPLIEESGYETRTMTGTTLEELQGIIADEQSSLPCCELDPEYFEYVDASYVPERGVDGWGRWPHTVIPFTINSSEVLFFDPFQEFFSGGSSPLDMNMDKDMWWEFWSRPEKRWTLWFEPEEQSTLSAFEDQ